MPVTLEEITRLYHRDQESNFRAVKRGDIPISYEAIEPEWFTSILCDGHPGAQVVSHTLGEADDGTSNRRRIFLEYNQAGQRAGLPRSVFCKAVHGLNNRIHSGMTGIGQAEVTFYNRIRPLIDIEAPEAFLANYDRQSCNMIVVFKDLTDANFCQHNTPIDSDRARQMVKLLARVHGQFLEAPGLYDGSMEVVTWPTFWSNLVSMDMEGGCRKGFLAAEEVIPARLYARAQEIWPATTKSVELHNTLPRTFLHGDTHLRNWYINSQGRMGLADWQGTSAGHWSRDLAYALTTSLTPEDRRAWEKDLILEYLDELTVVSGKATSYEKARTCYRQQLFTVLGYWTVTLTPPEGTHPADMQPRTSTLEFIKRISTAIDDLDALDSFM